MSFKTHLLISYELFCLNKMRIVLRNFYVNLLFLQKITLISVPIFQTNSSAALQNVRIRKQATLFQETAFNYLPEEFKSRTSTLNGFISITKHNQ